MQYLDDYLELIEQLPQEMRDNLTNIRELDLAVQNQVDSLEKRTRDIFQKCDTGEMTATEAEEQMQIIRTEYKKPMEDSEEKVVIAKQTQELFERYVKKLDAELAKFKRELEADNPGITAELERRCLEREEHTETASSALKYMEGAYSPYSGSYTTSAMRKQSRQRKLEKRTDQFQNSTSEKNSYTHYSGMNVGTPASVRSSVSSMNSTTNSGGTHLPALATNNYNLSQINGEVAHDIVAAASQAILTTQQLSQGRRTASLKASYEAVSGATSSSDLSATISTQLLHNTNSATQYTNEKKQRKPNSIMPTCTTTPIISRSTTVSGAPVDYIVAVYANQAPSNITISPQQQTTEPIMPTSNIAASTDNIMLTTSNAVPEVPVEEWTYDPNEPRYCICNQVSYGDMVACDNSSCPHEWFHYSCVGITTPPKGKWFCPKCTNNNIRRRNQRKQLTFHK